MPFHSLQLFFQLLSNCQVVAMHNLDHTHKDDAKIDLLREDIHLALAHKEQF